MHCCGTRHQVFVWRWRNVAEYITQFMCVRNFLLIIIITWSYTRWALNTNHEFHFIIALVYLPVTFSLSHSHSSISVWSLTENKPDVSTVYWELQEAQTHTHLTEVATEYEPINSTLEIDRKRERKTIKLRVIVWSGRSRRTVRFTCVHLESTTATKTTTVAAKNSSFLHYLISVLLNCEISPLWRIQADNCWLIDRNQRMMTTTTMRNGMAGLAALVIIVISHFLQLNCTESSNQLVFGRDTIPIVASQWNSRKCRSEKRARDDGEKNIQWGEGLAECVGQFEEIIIIIMHSMASFFWMRCVRDAHTSCTMYLRHTHIHGANEILAFGRSVTDAQSNLYVKSFMFTPFVYSA